MPATDVAAIVATPLDARGGFVEHGDAIDTGQLAVRMGERGMRWAAVLGQGNTNRHRLDVGVLFRDRMRAHGVAVPLWVVLDADDGAPDPDWQACAALTLELAPHFDGLVLNLERIENRGGLIEYVRRLLDGGVPAPSIVWSCLPRIAGGEVTRVLDNGLATLAQQAYAHENGHDVVTCKAYIETPPVYVGWSYRAVVLGRGRRVTITGHDQLGAIVKEGRNTWGCDGSRRIFNRRTNKTVGRLGGLWATHRRYGPTIRTTPYNGRVVTVDEAFAELDANGVPGGSVYLLESSTWTRPGAASVAAAGAELAVAVALAEPLPTLRETLTAETVATLTST